MDASLFYMDLLELGIIMHRSRWQTGVTGHMSNGTHIGHLFVKCQKIKHLDYGGGSQKKINWHNIWGSHILTSILTSHMMVTKNPQNVHRNYFWAILLIFIFDINICEPHYVNLFFFVNLLHSLDVWLFDIWHLFDNLTSFWHFDTSIKLKPPQPAQGYFFLGRSLSYGRPSDWPFRGQNVNIPFTAWRVNDRVTVSIGDL